MEIIDLTPGNIAGYGVCGYKDPVKHTELQNKIDWFSRYYPEGLGIKALLADDGSYQGMIEYIPGEIAHRPVEAEGYLFIHCIFLGFKKEHKGRGYGSALIGACVDEAKSRGMKGVAAAARKGSFMAGKEIFVKNGFNEADTADPDFSLMVLPFTEGAEPPRFMNDLSSRAAAYGKGVTILRSVQCPYTEKNVRAMLETTREEFGLDARLEDLSTADDARQSPSPFGTFCLIHDGEIISHHPISNTRFVNIMRKRIN